LNIWQPAQIHIHVHMRLAGTSLCQRCRVPDEILSAPNNPQKESETGRTVPQVCETLEKQFLSKK
jgi:hypothetical protein